MDIWILVGVLLLVAIILLVMSMFSEDRSHSLEEIEQIMPKLVGKRYEEFMKKLFD